MTRPERRQEKKKHERDFAAFCRITRRYFPDFVQWLQNVKDPRKFWTYETEVMLMTVIMNVGRHFKWSGDCTVAANKNLPIKAVTHTACGKKRHAFFLHRTGKAVSWYL